MTIEYFKRIIKILITKYYYGVGLKHIGKSVIINSPLTINIKKNISIGDYTNIGFKSWLGATPSTGYDSCNLNIGSNCGIGNFNHIYATSSIVIKDFVLTADKVYISDNLHGYEDINIPIINQKIVQKQPVVIGEGSWIGENVCIIGASIGKHSVIGANSVVTHDVPDYSVAVGIPARVVKRYDFEQRKWIKV